MYIAEAGLTGGEQFVTSPAVMAHAHPPLCFDSGLFLRIVNCELSLDFVPGPHFHNRPSGPAAQRPSGPAAQRPSGRNCALRAVGARKPASPTATGAHARRHRARLPLLLAAVSVLAAAPAAAQGAPRGKPFIADVCRIHIGYEVLRRDNTDDHSDTCAASVTGNDVQCRETGTTSCSDSHSHSGSACAALPVPVINPGEAVAACIARLRRARARQQH